jgi:hypothetical protein
MDVLSTSPNGALIEFPIKLSIDYFGRTICKYCIQYQVAIGMDVFFHIPKWGALITFPMNSQNGTFKEKIVRA